MTGAASPYPEYKESNVEWLGPVPEHWKAIRIGHLSPVKRGASPRPIDDAKYFDDDGEYAWTRIADVTASDVYLTNSPQRLSDLGSSLSVKLEPGELFLSIAATVGKPCITAIKACIHDGFVYFPELRIPPKFLFYVFAAEQAYKGLGKMGTQLNLNTDTVAGIKVGIGSTDELASIVAFLDYETAKIDALIEKQQQLIELLKEKRQAVISHAVTKGLNPDAPMRDSGVEWLGKVPAHWTLSCPKHFSHKIIDGPHITPKYVDEGIPFVTVKNLTQGESISLDDTQKISREDHKEFIKRARPEVGDVLITKDGTLGVTRVVETSEEFSIFVSVALIKLQREIADPYFVRFAFESSLSWGQFAVMSAGAALKHIVLTTISNVTVPMPPLDEQQNIGRIIREKCVLIDELVDASKKRVQLLQERRTALIFAAVTGKIDVRGWKPPASDAAAEVA